MLKRRKRQLWSVFVISAILTLGGCYPQGATYIDELDMTVTIKNEEINYDNLQTFYIHDTVALIKNNSKDEILDDDDAQFLVSEFRNPYAGARLDRSHHPSNGYPGCSHF